MSLPQACAVLVCIPLVCASLPSLNNTSIIHTLDTSDSPCSNNTRTLWNILLSCGLTLFACTWTAIHTNIPGMDEAKFAITSRRVFIMVMALIAPELITTWATRQFFSAQWTMTHGFFAWMGGFMLYVDGKPRATLAPDELLRFVRDGSVDIPLISEAEIEDRSKGDALSKGIALLQLLWFVIQLVARYDQNLSTTLLEINTLAAAALTCVLYGLWWKKPKDVGCPYVVHWKGRASPIGFTYESDVTSFDASPLNYITYPFTSLMGFGADISPSAARYHRVPSLGGYGEYNAKIVLVIGCFSGMVFGGIHCLGWNYLFHRHAEHMLWRAASISIACAPVLILLHCVYLMWTFSFAYLGGVIAVLLMFISTLIYIVARIMLIVLMIMSLRSLPLGVYDTVAWTTFIPHFNM
ncbi:hypothetical protein DEU56DRAFT_935330 [Suillus clintonianus]|uniref:uncharacterized protein n=1 Tax=Suillus clintonianus TaxID=1904413 RepID=UPI001B85C606|nr:uncharacterized protein DEU56DRAFT_935330 [Suillus clintonianus]KAG2111833.1 hypothetical protein DEU56DRAFT_935330 [Suillus clintonianus]